MWIIPKYLVQIYCFLLATVIIFTFILRTNVCWNFIQNFSWFICEANYSILFHYYTRWNFCNKFGYGPYWQLVTQLLCNQLTRLIQGGQGVWYVYYIVSRLLVVCSAFNQIQVQVHCNNIQYCMYKKYYSWIIHQIWYCKLIEEKYIANTVE